MLLKNFRAIEGNSQEIKIGDDIRISVFLRKGLQTIRISVDAPQKLPITFDQQSIRNEIE
jgi:sRNA-binding carbon storage regulator CsrA